MSWLIAIGVTPPRRATKRNSELAAVTSALAQPDLA
jgi:hypothetical protein